MFKLLSLFDDRMKLILVLSIIVSIILILVIFLTQPNTEKIIDITLTRDCFQVTFDSYPTQ